MEWSRPSLPTGPLPSRGSDRVQRRYEICNTVVIMRTVALTASVLALLTLAVGCSSAEEVADEPEAADEGALVLGAPLEKAALANLERIAREIDAAHLNNYGSLPANTSADFNKTVAKKFLDAVKLEYVKEPELLKRRVQTIASMVFFAAPEVKTDEAVGRVTPFHGMDDTAFQNLMTNEDFVWNSHTTANGGSTKGIRPFSVCETKFLIKISKGEVTGAYAQNKTLTNYDQYAQAYKTAAASCEKKDLDEWYDFRGLGGLRPSWLESNYSDRVLRRMLTLCKSGSTSDVCTEFAKDRLAYRDRKNSQMALRQMVFDTRAESKIGDVQDGMYMRNPGSPGVFVEDRNGDQVADWIAPGPATLVPGAKLKGDNNTTYTVSADGKSLAPASGEKLPITSATVAINSSGQFGGGLQLSIVSGSQTLSMKAPTGAVVALDRVDPKWKKENINKPDFGFMEMFSDSTGCTGDAPTDQSCPLLARFFSMIDRHENFYQTYSSLDANSSSVSSQPSPLVACSVTLAAANSWSSAGTPQGGTAGFIYLMRVPFAQILTGDVRSIDTLGRLKGDLKSGPKTITLQSLYNGQSKLDMSKVWVDVATLSNNQYQNEHEISKFGSVPAEQIEGILVIRKPAAMTPAPTPAPGAPAANGPAAPPGLVNDGVAPVG